jgi:hypothetical protein
MPDVYAFGIFIYIRLSCFIRRGGQVTVPDKSGRERFRFQV